MVGKVSIVSQATKLMEYPTAASKNPKITSAQKIKMDAREYGRRFFSDKFREFRNSDEGKSLRLFKKIELLDNAGVKDVDQNHLKVINAKINEVNEKIELIRNRLIELLDEEGQIPPKIQLLVGRLIVETVHFRTLNEENQLKWRKKFSVGNAHKYGFGNAEELKASLRRIDGLLNNLNDTLNKLGRDSEKRRRDEESKYAETKPTSRGARRDGAVNPMFSEDSTHTNRSIEEVPIDAADTDPSSRNAIKSSYSYRVHNDDDRRKPDNPSSVLSFEEPSRKPNSSKRIRTDKTSWANAEQMLLSLDGLPLLAEPEKKKRSAAVSQFSNAGVSFKKVFAGTFGARSTHGGNSGNTSSKLPTL